MDVEGQEPESVDEIPLNGVALETATETTKVEGGEEVGRAGNDKNNSFNLKRETVVGARPIVQGRGHTGYLTFARKAVDVE